MAYNKDTDYSLLIKQAADKGDFTTAAALEAQRNEKIDTEGMNYAKTNTYSSYLNQGTNPTQNDYGVDYSKQIDSLIKNNGKVSDVQNALNSRTQKALGSPELNQYAYDKYYDMAMEYINNNKYRGKAESYEAQGDTARDKYETLLDSLINREGFSYDQMSDPYYQAAATQYHNKGKLAAQDTMADYASMTGGMPSTAAVSAAQQMQNQYNSELGALVPDFIDSAYSRYQQELGNDIDVLNLVGNNRSYYDSIEQNATDNQNYLDETAAAAVQTQKTNAMNLWDMYGYATQEVADILGVPVGTPTSSQSYQNAQMELSQQEYELSKYKATKSSGGSSSDSGDSGSSDIDYSELSTDNATQHLNEFVAQLRRFVSNGAGVRDLSDQIDGWVDGGKISEAQGAQLYELINNGSIKYNNNPNGYVTTAGLRGV